MTSKFVFWIAFAILLINGLLFVNVGELIMNWWNALLVKTGLRKAPKKRKYVRKPSNNSAAKAAKTRTEKALKAAEQVQGYITKESTKTTKPLIDDPAVKQQTYQYADDVYAKPSEMNSSVDSNLYGRSNGGGSWSGS